MMAGYTYKGSYTGPDLFDLTAEPETKDKTNPSKPAPKPCGTHAAYFRHIRNKERPCNPCLQAAADYMAQRRGTLTRKLPGQAACGTRSGYNAHRRHKETPCTACKQANAEAQRQYAARKQAA